MQPIQRQLCRNRKRFTQFFSAFRKPKIHFEHFGKKDEPQR